jgi:hypothetical protein
VRDGLLRVGGLHVLGHHLAHRHGEQRRPDTAEGADDIALGRDPADLLVLVTYEHSADTEPAQPVDDLGDRVPRQDRVNGAALRVEDVGDLHFSPFALAA